MQASSSSWQWPPSTATSSQKNPHPYLQHTVSMANLHGDTWQQWRSPPSPTSSTASSISRGATPTNSTPHSLTNNPWANSMLNLSSRPTSPPDPNPPSPPSSTSRCATPVAPLPIRPNAAIQAVSAAVVNHEIRSPTRVSPTQMLSEMPTSPTPNPYKQTQMMMPMPVLPANVISPALVAWMTRSIPNILIRLNWESSKAQRFYCWAVPNPRTALLFWMCDDLAAWPRALFFGLEDTMLPYKEADLEGIAADPRKVVLNQWRVMVRELPRTGHHLDFQAKEAVPLQVVGVLKTTSTQSRTVEKVRWITEEDGRTYVRKQFATSRQSQKSTLQQQLQQFKRLDHPNIGKITCTYTQHASFSVVTHASQFNLDDYLRSTSPASQQKEMMNWINDLTDALAYIHSNDMYHGCIRPQKIMVDGVKIFYSAFGFFNSTIAGSSRESEASAAEEEAYIYAAPELIAYRKAGRAGDVFSLGCVLLTILSVIKGQTTSTFQNYRSSGLYDPSFHANLNQVSSWITRLRTARSLTGQRREKVHLAENQALDFVEAMLTPDAAKRVKMKKLVKHVIQWNENRLVTRRRSLDRIDVVDVGAAKWADLGSLNSYYSPR